MAPHLAKFCDLSVTFQFTFEKTESSGSCPGLVGGEGVSQLEHRTLPAPSSGIFSYVLKTELINADST